jgi:hypothetical protein
MRELNADRLCEEIFSCLAKQEVKHVLWQTIYLLEAVI